MPMVIWMYYRFCVFVSLLLTLEFYVQQAIIHVLEMWLYPFKIVFLAALLALIKYKERR